MKSKIFYIIVLLLVSCDNADNNKLKVEKNKQVIQKETVNKIEKKTLERKQASNKKNNKVIGQKKEKSADKNKVSQITDGFDENIKISLMDKDELKEYVINAVEIWDNKNLGYLIHRLKASKQYELAIFVASNRVEKSETHLEHAENQYTYALTLFEVCHNKNDYKSGIQILNKSIDEYDNLMRNNETFTENNLVFMIGAYDFCVGRIVKYENDINTAMSYIKRYENVMESYIGEREKFFKDYGIGNMYYFIAENVVNTKDKVKWDISSENLEQIKKYASTLSETEQAPIFENSNLKFGMQPLKKILLQIVQKNEKEVMPMLK